MKISECNVVPRRQPIWSCRLGLIRFSSVVLIAWSLTLGACSTGVMATNTSGDQDDIGDTSGGDGDADIECTACSEGAIASACCCGGVQRSTGYCCSNLFSLTACEAPVDGCESGEVLSRCKCGNTIVAQGYCCADVPEEESCNPPACQNGLVTARCTCGTVAVSGDYCCSGRVESSPCAPDACENGPVTTPCTCGGSSVTGGTCCSGVAGTTPCGPSALRLDGGLASGTSTYNGHIFYPLLPYLTAGVSGDSTESSIPPLSIANTEYDGLYRDESWVSDPSATFTVTGLGNGQYTVHLHFVDWAANPTTNPGDRLFHVDLQGNRKVTNLDIIGRVGTSAALVLSFDVTVTNQTLTLTMTNSVFAAEIAAMEILPIGEAHLPTVECGDADGVCPAVCTHDLDVDCPAACAQGAVTSACTCGTTVVTTGFCCGGAPSGSSCAPAACGEGAVTATCTCGSSVVTTGFCCGGAPSGSSCAPAACGEGTVTGTCTCGSTVVTTGYCCGGAPAGAPCSGAVAYYFSSSSGDDSRTADQAKNPATPWASLTKLNSVMSTLNPGEYVLFKRGDTFYGQLTMSKSGSAGSPITFGAYGSGDRPVITDFTAVTNWTNKGGNIWESTNAVSTLSSCNMVTINGVNTAMGRYPKVTAANHGYLTFQTHSDDTSITSSELSGSPNWTGAEVVVRTSAYKLGRGTVTSHSAGTLTFSPLGEPPEDDNGFFFQNDLRCCTQQNDWYYNPSTKKISVYSTTQPTNVKVASIDKLITLEADYISFVNVAFAGANEAGLFAPVWSEQHDVSFDSCAFSNMGISAIYAPIDYLTIQNSSFSDSNNNAVSTDTGENITIRGNTFENIGLFQGMKDLRDYGLANGNVEALNTKNYLFEKNTIRNVGYNGIWFHGINVTIRQNFFEKFCVILDDGGAIYTYTGDYLPLMENVLITQNTCIDSSGESGDGQNYPLSGSGIYLDDKSANVEISYNTIANTFLYGIYVASAGNVNIHHNTVFNATQYQMFNVIAAGREPSTTDKLRNNILVAAIKNPEDEEGNYWGFQKSLFIWADTPTPDADAKAASTDMDYNCYARPVADDDVIFVTLSDFGQSSMTVSEWRTWSGQDAHSSGSPQAITDPNELRLEYNATGAAKTVTLSQPMIDMAGNQYASSIALQPYSSAVLMNDHSAKKSR